MNEALQAYSSVLETSQPDETPLRLPLRDWLVLSRHLAERGMPREAAGEFEKLGLAYPGDAMAAEALVNAAEIRLQLGEYDYAGNIFAFVRQQSDLDANLLLRMAESEAQLNNLTRGRNAA